MTRPPLCQTGTAAPEDFDDVHVYVPTTRPGSILPHAWLQRLGKRVALCDLAGHGHFLLIAGEEGEAWCEAATQIAQARGLPLQAIRISPFAGDWLDLPFDWLRQREISPQGAILVRPDRHIAGALWARTRTHELPWKVRSTRSLVFVRPLLAKKCWQEGALICSFLLSVFLAKGYQS